MSNKNSDYYFLKGGGEMGELIREKDWSKTPLGNPEDWPDSLRTMVAVMLENPFGMYIAWGSDYTQIYNDAYRPILGATKHPQALGISTRETFSEIWHIIESMFDDVMVGKAVSFPDFMLPLNRNGFIEECYFDFSYSPIRKNDGEVGGVLVTVMETTDKKRVEERLRESHEHFRNTMKQVPMGITILRGPEYMVEMANDAYLQLVDKKESDFVGNPLFTSLPEVEESVHSLLDNVLNTGIPYHGNEVPIPVNRYGKQDVFYFDFLYYPLKEADGKISGIIVSVTEVTEKVEIRKKIEERKRLYETITQNTPDLIYVFDLNYKYTFANEALQQMWGHTSDYAIGKGMLEVGYEPWHAQMHEREIDQVILTQKPVRGEFSFPHFTLGKRIYDYIFVPVIDQDGKVEAIAGTARDITQQVDARIQIEQSEMRFRNLVQQAPVSICVLRGKDFVVEAANDKQLQLWGKTKEQVMNIPVFTAISEGAGQGFDLLLNNVYDTGIPVVANEASLTLIRNNIEETIYVNFVCEPLYNTEHIIDGVISVATEITEQVVARKIIEESEQRFQAAVSAVQGILWTNNAQGEMEGQQTGWASLTGQNYDDYQGYGWAKAIHPDDAQASVDAWNKAVANRSTFEFEHRVATKQNGWRLFSVRAVPIMNEKGIIKQWVGVHTDITEQREVEQKIKESEQKFRLLANAMPQHIWTSDPEGNLNYFNQSVYDYSGLTVEQIDQEGWLQIVHPDDREENIKKWMNSITTGIDFLCEHRFRRHDGAFRWQLSRAIPQKDDRGNVQMWVGTSTDIQDQKTFTTELERQVDERTKELALKNNELQKMNKELESFVYVSSHDLQEPLRKIQTFASHILEKEVDNLSEMGKDYFNRTHKAAQRMQTLIQDLLAYSRTNSAEYKLENTNLNIIIAEVKDELREELKEKNATIEATQLSNAHIIPFQFRQLMHNLIINSLKFSNPENPPHIKIKSVIAKGLEFNNPKLSPQNNYCHITVSDNGIGFEQKYGEKIFELFQRLHGRNEYKGTGIGLSIVKKIIDNHNGIITASSELNKGATFDIYIPMA